MKDYVTKTQHLYLFWWVVTVEFFSPQLCIHLQTYIFKVDISVDTSCHVPLRDIVMCMLPVSRAWITGYLLSAYQKQQTIQQQYCESKSFFYTRQQSTLSWCNLFCLSSYNDTLIPLSYQSQKHASAHHFQHTLHATENVKSIRLQTSNIQQSTSVPNLKFPYSSTTARRKAMQHL